MPDAKCVILGEMLAARSNEKQGSLLAYSRPEPGESQPPCMSPNGTVEALEKGLEGVGLTLQGLNSSIPSPLSGVIVNFTLGVIGSST
jgi:hypothetical protein